MLALVILKVDDDLVVKPNSNWMNEDNLKLLLYNAGLATKESLVQVSSYVPITGETIMEAGLGDLKINKDNFIDTPPETGSESMFNKCVLEGLINLVAAVRIRLKDPTISVNQTGPCHISFSKSDEHIKEGIKKIIDQFIVIEWENVYDAMSEQERINEMINKGG